MSRPRPALLPPRSNQRVSVISPRIFVTGGDCGVSSVHSEPEVSLDWDNFAEIPKFVDTRAAREAQEIHIENCSPEVDDITGIEDVQKVTLVDTSVSSLSSNHEPIAPQNTVKMAVSQDQESMKQHMIQENEKTVLLRDTVYDLMEDFPANRVRMGNILHVQSKLDKISEARTKFRNAVRYYKKTFVDFHPANCSALTSQLDTMTSDIHSYEDAIWSRVEQLQGEQQSPPTPPNSGGGGGGTAYVHTAPHSSSSSGNQGYSSPSDLMFRKNVYKDHLLHLRDALSLPAHDTIDEHWVEKSDCEVSQAMKDIGTWQKSVGKLSQAFREYEKVATGVGDEELETLSEDFEEVRVQVKAVILAVKSEDEKRNLQTLMPAKSDKVKYPQFSGDPGEDFVKFRDKLKECFRKNRVPASDQLDKLRENLTGQALKRVPETLKDLDRAWQNLSEAFGSPLIVLKERLKSLSELGNIPSDEDPGEQITWLLDFEAVLQDILDLGESDDLNMQMGAYGPPVQEQILKAFDDNPLKKIEVAKAGRGKHPKQKILGYQEMIQGFRREIQFAEVESGNTFDKRTLPALYDHAAVCQHNKSAVEKLEKLVEKEMLPVPNGHPMFLFFGAKGKTRSLMVFFDSGCSRFIMKDCIPEKELPAVCVRRGKIPISGVGSTTVYAEAEYLVAMETTDGKAQQMQGLVVKNITTDFPQLDISNAADEMRSAGPVRKNWNMKRCKLPQTIGGSVDCLIGIQYNQLQPRLVHMLPSGLAIYRTKLAPHVKGFNYVLGGPHASFDTWLAQHGNQNHLLLENFVAGLAQWRSLGPPSLSQYMMTATENIKPKEFEKDEHEDTQLEMSVRIEELEAEIPVNPSQTPASRGGGDRGGRAYVHAATNPVSPSEDGGTGGGHPAGEEQGDDGEVPEDPGDYHVPEGPGDLVCTAQEDCYYEICRKESGNSVLLDEEICSSSNQTEVDKLHNSTESPARKLAKKKKIAPDKVFKKKAAKVRRKKNLPRITKRSVRKFIRIWSADDPGGGPGVGQEARMVQDGVLVPAYPSLPRPSGCQCCCLPHCSINLHNIYNSKSMIQTFPPSTGLEMDEEDEEVDDADNITALIMSVGMDLF